jgi:signal transduction histidine kinase/CheY-like chemotaxis protein/HAMP domain-containing protein
MHRFFFSLRFRLILLVLLAVIPALGLILYTGIEERRIAAAQAKEDALRLVRLVSSNQSQLIEGARHFLYTLAQLSQVRNCDPAACCSLFATLLRQYPWYLNIGVAGQDGNIFASALPLARPVNAADRKWFQRAFKTCAFSIGDYQIGRITGKPSVNFGHPVLNEEGKVKAVVFVALDLTWLNQLPAKVQLPLGSTLTRIDQSGMILARHPEPEKWVGKTLRASMTRIILSQGEGMTEAIGIDGTPRLYVFTPFGDKATAGNLYLSIGIPTSVVFTKVDQILRRNLTFLGFVALLALVAAWVGGDLLLARRLNVLVRVTKRLGTGDLSACTGTTRGRGELGQLDLAFDNMAESLEQRDSERKQAEETLKLNESRLETLLKLNQMADIPLQEIMNYTLEEATRLTESQIGYLSFVNEDETVLTMYAWSKSAMERCRITDKPLTYPIATTGLWGEAVRQRKPIITNDYTAPNPLKKGYPEGHVEIIRHMNVPIFDRDHIVIVAGVGNKASDYNETDVRQLTLLMTEMWRIIQRKRAEEEMATLQEQLRQSQKMEAIGRLAGGVAHDFNNSLTVIKGYSQLSLTGLKKDDPLRPDMEEIQKAAERAANLTRQLLAFSRRQILEMKVLDLNTILRDLDKMLRRIIGEDIELVTLFAEDLGTVKTDHGQMEQVIMNLAVNSRDAMPNGGKLTIETANVTLDQEYARKHIAVKPGHYIMLSVSDTGCGMTPEVRDRVFEPFFTTKEKGKGTGLGLSTVYGIVKQSGGNIWVYSEPSQGTTFKIYLPRVDEPLEQLDKATKTDEIPQGNETILVVEDDEAVRKLAVRVLEKQGYTVLEAQQGNEALNICQQRKEPVHLILVDVIMPDLSGRQLIDNLKQVWRDFKVLYMSGYTDNAIVHHGVLEKGVNYLQKPFTFEGLARKMREVLDKSS